MHMEVPSKGLRPYITTSLMTPTPEYPATMDKLKSLDMFHHLMHYLKENHLLDAHRTPDRDPKLNEAVNAMKTAYSTFFAHVAKNTKDHEVKKSYASDMIDQLFNLCVEKHITISCNDKKFNEAVNGLMNSSLCSVNHKHLH